jgi:hypothetical protein
MPRFKLHLCIVAGLAVALGGRASRPAEQLGKSAIELQMRHYLRDVTELPLIVTSEITVTDNKSGRVTEHRRSSHQFTYEAGASLHKRGEAEQVGASKVKTWEIHADLGALATAYVFLPKQWNSFYQVSEPHESEDHAIVMEYRSKENCSPWEKTGLFGSGMKFKRWCGAGQIRFKLDDGAPLDTTFDAFQIAPGGKGTDVPSYHYEMTFQRVMISGHSEPFTLPREVTLKVVSKRETVVVHNAFAPKPQ